MPTLVSRWRYLDRLLTRLQPQLTDAVGILTMTDERKLSIGAKRQVMLQEATAEWVSFFDDDDVPPFDYVGRILGVIEGADPPDVVGFRLRMFTDGKVSGFAVHSYEAATIPIPGLTREHNRYDRKPNHLNPVRRALALRVGYKNLKEGEDGDYALRLAALSPRPRETFLDWYGYNYLYRSDRPEWKR